MCLGEERERARERDGKGERGRERKEGTKGKTARLGVHVVAQLRRARGCSTDSFLNSFAHLTAVMSKVEKSPHCDVGCQQTSR